MRITRERDTEEGGRKRAWRGVLEEQGDLGRKHMGAVELCVCVCVKCVWGWVCDPLLLGHSEPRVCVCADINCALSHTEIGRAHV